MDFIKNQLNNVELGDDTNSFEIKFSSKIKQSINIEIYG